MSNDDKDIDDAVESVVLGVKLLSIFGAFAATSLLTLGLSKTAKAALKQSADAKTKQIRDTKALQLAEAERLRRVQPYLRESYTSSNSDDEEDDLVDGDWWEGIDDDEEDDDQAW